MEIKESHLIEASLLNTPSLDCEKLLDALSKLISRYDHLRLRYSYEGGKKIRCYAENVEDCYLFDELALHDSGGDVKKLIRVWCNQLTSKLHLESGPVIAVGLIKGAIDTSDLLFFSIHRKVADRVAWRILVSELYSLYEGLDIFSSPSTYKDWLKGMHLYAQNRIVMQNHLEFWKKIEGKIKNKEFIKNNNIDVMNSSKKSTTEIFDSDKVLIGIDNLQLKYSVNSEDLFLSSVIYALKEFYKTNKIALTLTHHGRDSVYKEIDFIRTIGYCQIDFPIILGINDQISDTLVNILKSVVNQREGLPKNGISYPALAHFHPDAAVRSQLNAKGLPDINFNFLGNFDQLDAISNWTISDLYPGWEHGFSRRQYAIAFTIFSYKKKMYINLSYQDDLLSESDVNSILKNIRQFIGKLDELVKMDSFFKSKRSLEKTHRYTYDPIVILNEEKHGSPPYIFLHPGDGGAESYLNGLYSCMRFDEKVFLFNNYVFHSGDLINCPQSFEELAHLYINLIDEKSLVNGVRLVGYSFGAVLAFEMAIQLECKGIKILELNLIDPILISSILMNEKANSLHLPRSLNSYLAAYQSQEKPKINALIRFFKANLNEYGPTPSGIEEKLKAASVLPFNGLFLNKSNNVSIIKINCNHYQMLSQPYFNEIMKEILSNKQSF